MRRTKAYSHDGASGLFVFLLLGIFALCSTLMVVFGAGAYRDSQNRLSRNDDRRILSSYVRSMVRAQDEEGAVYVEDAGGVRTVTLAYGFEEDAYLTRIYVADGYLREWFSDASREFVPAEGEKIAEASTMEADLENGLLSVQITDPAGEELRSVIAVRTAQNQADEA